MRNWKAFGSILAVLALAGSVYAATTYPKGVPGEGSALFDFAATGGTPVFATDFAPQASSHPATYLEIGVCVETDSTVGIEISDGTTTKIALLNSGLVIPAGAGATFIWPIDLKDQDGEALAFNIVFGVNTNLTYLTVREIQGR